MKNLKFEYEDTEQLEKLIKTVYFENNNGKLSDKNDKKLILDPDTLYYRTLSGLTGYKIKLRNSELIDGSMEFDLIEDEQGVSLSPSSIYCIKEKKYSFY